MPFVYQREPKGFVFSFSGFITHEEFQNALEVIFNDPDFEHVSYVICDYTGIVDLELTPREVKYAAALSLGSSHINHRLRLAVIITNPKVLALHEVYMATQSSAYPTRQVTSMEAARAWVNEPR